MKEIIFVSNFQVVSVSCGGSHTVCLTSSGRAYSFGQSSNGQLGLTTKTLESLEPAIIQIMAASTEPNVMKL